MSAAKSASKSKPKPKPADKFLLSRKGSELSGWSHTQGCASAGRVIFEKGINVNRQCRTIIGNPPWPFKICWLCGFPVGEESIEEENEDEDEDEDENEDENEVENKQKSGDNNPTMIESIARRMDLNCYFVNNASKRYDRQTCEHVFPVKLLGPTLLMKKNYKSTEGKYTLNTEEAIDLAHDFCNLIKKHGYTATLKKTQTGTQLALSYKGLEVASFQVNNWPDYLLDGFLSGKSQSSIIGISQKSGGPIIWFKSSVHVYLFFKLLELTDKNRWLDLFKNYGSNIQLPIALPIDNNMTAIIRDIRNIPEASGIVEEWKKAIKTAMTARTQTLIDFLLLTDDKLGNIILPLLYTCLDPKTTILYEGKERTHAELSDILQTRLDNLDVSDLTNAQKEKLKTFVRAKKGEARGHAVPLAQLPRSMSLREYVESPIFQLQIIEELKDKDIQSALGIVTSFKYNQTFRNDLKNVINQTSIDKLVTSRLQRAPSIVLLELADEIKKAQVTTCEEEVSTNSKASAQAAFATNPFASNPSTSNSQGTQLEFYTANNNSGNMSGTLQPAAASSASATLRNFSRAVPLALFGQQQMQPQQQAQQGNQTKKRAAPKNRNNNGINSMTTNNNQTRSVRRKVTVARTLPRPPSPQQTTGSQGGYRNHRTRKQKKNKKTRKNKKLTKRF
jgi:hypothetical protein